MSDIYESGIDTDYPLKRFIRIADRSIKDDIIQRLDYVEDYVGKKYLDIKKYGEMTGYNIDITRKNDGILYIIINDRNSQ